MLNRLRKSLESEKKDKAIFDIVLYGSAVKGTQKPRDIDILVIFLEGSLRDRLERIQKIKFKLNETNVDIKQIMIHELFSSDFMARTGIFLGGISIFRKIPFSELLGFKAYALFSYQLEGMKHAQKVRFNYILAGRNGMKGMLKELAAERIAYGAVKVPITRSLEFEEILKANGVKFVKKEILESQ